MASTSSSSIIASPSANYDIFLSFRGVDTRHSFTDHLYAALNRAGISAFRDKEETRRGEELKPEIEKAIRASKGSIIVLSKNYATSTWCLDELWLILERRREFDHFVLPVFYHVDPSHVRNQDDTFKIEVKASSKWTDDNVKRWRKALTRVAELSGLVLSAGSETNFLKEIIDNIYYKVARKIVNLPPNLTGMNARVKDINSWLEESDVKVLAICGMGGSGKTTLAQYIISSNWRHFEVTSVVENISSTFEKEQNLDKLFRKFAKDIIGGGRKRSWQDRDILDPALQLKKALIVLDDINERTQVRSFLGDIRLINRRSKIIITTRKSDTHKWLTRREEPIRCREYKMQLLDVDEALELLSLHAFGSKFPMEGYHKLAKEVIQYCDGNPLALKVLGSSLSEDSSIAFWTSTLNLLKIEMNYGIQRVLVRSYDTLPNKKNKELFLHIACFFVGEDKDYVEKILEPDYCASSGIKVLTNRCLLSVSSNNKLMMHQLIQRMGKSIILGESKRPEERSRSWLSRDSYKILHKGEGSKTMEGLALDMQVLQIDQSLLKSSDLKTDSLTKMVNLKLLLLNDVHLTESYEEFSEDLRWLCWRHFRLTAIPSGLFQGNLVAIDMRDSNLEVFEPPIVLPSLKTLNLEGSKSLSDICNIFRLPNLENLIVCSCPELVHVCESIGGLENLTQLNMIGCKSLPWHLPPSNRRLKASTSGGASPQQTSFLLPHSLVWLSLRDCNLERTKFFPLSFSDERKLQYLDLGGGEFESLPSYNHLKNLCVLDLSLCPRLKWLLCLPSTLAELYVYYCESLERITFQSAKFTLEEFGYQGCSSLFEIEGFLKFVPIAKLDETDLGHLKWLKKYQSHEVLLLGDDELTSGRSRHIQMLIEFGIMSTSLPNIKDPNVICEYLSESSSVSFSVPPCPRNRRLKGINITFRYVFNYDTISVDMDWAWFAKINTISGVDYVYNPRVFGNPGFGEVGIWLSYWPIGNKLNAGDVVNISIVLSGYLEVLECGASLVYVDDDEALEINMKGVEETLGGDLSAFQLRTGGYYLCRRDFYNLMEVGSLSPGWLSILVGDTIDDTEVRGWRKTGRPKPSFDPSPTELSVPSFDPSLTDLPYPSTSSSSIIPSPSANYDIFLSFRGENTRHSFTDHLHAALNRVGISAFRDNEEISRGEELKPEIEKATRASN